MQNIIKIDTKVDEKLATIISTFGYELKKNLFIYKSDDIKICDYKAMEDKHEYHITTDNNYYVYRSNSNAFFYNKDMDIINNEYEKALDKINSDELELLLKALMCLGSYKDDLIKIVPMWEEVNKSGYIYKAYSGVKVYLRSGEKVFDYNIKNKNYSIYKKGDWESYVFRLFYDIYESKTQIQRNVK